MGMGVTNSVVGIVGCGNIGIIVAEMLRGFKLKELLYTSRKPKAEGENQVNEEKHELIILHRAASDFNVHLYYFFIFFVPSVESFGGRMVSVDDLIRRSDFIILTGILIPETKFTINKTRLELMKPNAVVINVGRGRKLIFTETIRHPLIRAQCFENKTCKMLLFMIVITLHRPPMKNNCRRNPAFVIHFIV